MYNPGSNWPHGVCYVHFGNGFQNSRRNGQNTVIGFAHTIGLGLKTHTVEEQLGTGTPLIGRFLGPRKNRPNINPSYWRSVYGINL